MDFKVKGNSRYNVRLIDGVVEKSTSTEDGRLYKSILKQLSFKSNYFNTPDVYEYSHSKFNMEYIKGESFYQFLTTASKRDLDGFIQKLDGYFEERIIGEVEIPIEILIKKLKEISADTYYIDKFSKQNNITVKVGPCHGDMTLSNMIFTDKIYLIDFLDSYIESPTIDLVKLRQDTLLYWSLNMIDDEVDTTKIKIGLNYIDNWLVDKYKIDNYELFQIINLLRIFPYTKNEKIKKYLDYNLKKLCEHL